MAGKDDWMSSFERLKELTELHATSGREEQVRDYMREQMKEFVHDFQTDGLGSLFGLIPSKEKDAPTVMLAAHMDEVGFMLQSITEQGLFQVVALGGWNPQVVSAQRFILQTAKDTYPLVSSSVPPHLLKNGQQTSLDPSDILFDGGFESREQALEAGIRPGDTIVPDVKTVRLANKHRVLSKAFDNRYGCAAVLEVCQAVAHLDLPFNLLLGATVQEEVGLRGAKAAVETFKPDFFIAADASPASDLRHSKHNDGRLNGGFLVRVQDPGMITPYRIRQYIVDLAEKENIVYQYYFSKGGTDAVAAQVAHGGVPACVIGCPARYIHTHQSIFDLRDYQAAVDILIAIIKDLDENKIKSFQEF